ncbi:MAG: 4-hydroxy-tetrahydrodipicolinate synthase [Spirochaetes bacterium]|nr:4-hydroxy-tetrahydrodipicolinate synthase [Spirochaetota bacterium]
MFQGTYTAILTPFSGGQIDWATFEKLLDLQLAAKVEGIVPMGTTGESPTVPHEEHRQVVEFAVKRVKGRCKVIAGTGSNSTAETLELSRHAEKSGVDGCLLVTPYYNRPTPDGLERHFKAVSDAVGIPLVLYNIPGRTGTRLSAELIARLAAFKNIAAVKDATGECDLWSDVIRLCGDRLAVLSGNDSQILPLIAVGGRGVISVASNLIPQRVKALVDAALAGDLPKARQIQYEWWDLGKHLFLETNPIPVKAAAKAMGLIPDEELRLPLSPMGAAPRETLLKTLRAMKLVP